MRRREIIRILMYRDGMTKEEAREELNEVIEGMRELIAEGRYTEAEDYFSEELGLEPDYII